MRVLLIEDDPDTAAYVIKGLEEEGHTIDHTADGRDGMAQAMNDEYDVIIVDRMLPGLEGLAIVKTLRTEGNRTPVLILSALGDVDDRVKGLRAGGDDYLTKPYAYTELLARIEALARRAVPEEQETRYAVGDLVLDRLSHRVTRAGEPIQLQPREYRLLEYRMERPGRVFTREQLLDGVWGNDVYIDERTVDVHVGRLRKALNRGRDIDPIRTVRGSGYSIDDRFGKAG